MADSDRSHLVVWAQRGAFLGLVLMLLGPSILLVYAWSEVLNNPGVSLVDGYWIGRLPWIPLGIVPALTGGVIGLVSGAVTIAIVGGWWRRVLIVPAFAAAAFWWSMALYLYPMPYMQGPDPVTFAYSLPSSAAVFVLLPAVLLAGLSLTPRMPSPPRTRLRPIPHREPWSEPTPEGEPEV